MTITTLDRFREDVYEKVNLQLTDFVSENESMDYAASRFKIKDYQIIYRNAKITPKKIGQFVTFWKRPNNGPIEPYHEQDSFDFYVITVLSDEKAGQFIIPKFTLIEKGIISTKNKEGKRGFRVYPPWDEPTSKQALRSQKWQIQYFYQNNDGLNLNKIRQLFQKD